MDSPKPMLAKDAKGKPPRVPAGEGWIIEPKFDGWRFLFHRSRPGFPLVRSYSGRNGSDRTGQPSAIEQALEFLPCDTILDAELIVEGEPASKVSTVLANPRAGTLRAIVFDVLRVAGVDTTGLIWSQRRELLDRAAGGFGPQVEAAQFTLATQEQHEAWLDAGFEGSVAKRIGSRYQVGRRSDDWIKVKPQTTAEAEIIGFVAGKGGRIGEVGAFEIKMLDSGVETSCGTKDDAQRADVKRDPEAWLGRIIEIRHHGIREDTGLPRHPVFYRRREDRDRVPTPGLTA